MDLNSRTPSGPIESRWDNTKFEMKLVNPANKRKYSVLVVGSGQSGLEIAYDLVRQGKRVLLSAHPRVQLPRWYRDREIFEWTKEIALADQPVIFCERDEQVIDYATLSSLGVVFIGPLV